MNKPLEKIHLENNSKSGKDSIKMLITQGTHDIPQNLKNLKRIKERLELVQIEQFNKMLF